MLVYGRGGRRSPDLRGGPRCAAHYAGWCRDKIASLRSQ
jgi:hypothetical protein